MVKQVQHDRHGRLFWSSRIHFGISILVLDLWFGTFPMDRDLSAATETEKTNEVAFFHEKMVWIADRLTLSLRFDLNLDP